MCRRARGRGRGGQQQAGGMPRFCRKPVWQLSCKGQGAEGVLRAEEGCGEGCGEGKAESRGCHVERAHLLFPALLLLGADLRQQCQRLGVYIGLQRHLGRP